MYSLKGVRRGGGNEARLRGRRGASRFEGSAVDESLSLHGRIESHHAAKKEVKKGPGGTGIMAVCL